MQNKDLLLRRTQLLNTTLIEDEFLISESDSQELAALYAGENATFRLGAVVPGKVVSRETSGLLVDIGYKSNGLIPGFEFTSRELKGFVEGTPLEVMLDRLEDENGNVVLSYQKAKSAKAWDKIITLAKEDQPVTGVVLNKVKGGLSVDIGIPAFLPGSQVDIQRVADFDQFIGQEVTCKILKVNKKRGNVIISRRKFLEIERQANKSKVMSTINEGQILQGVAKNITNYGVFVDVGGVDGLLHITDMSWGRVNHPSELVKIGDLITVKVIGLDKDNEKISLGMKQLTANPWQDVELKYPVGKKMAGTVSSITDYGLFVEVSKGIEGLVHISEISWTERITNLHRHYTVGTAIDVVVVALDKENRRMSLSIKQLQEDPWQKVAQRHAVGDRIKGTISNITDFGIFVGIADGIDGLVHVSDISWTDHVSHPGDLYKKGDAVDAVILVMDIENKKISLGIKQLDKDPWQAVEVDFPLNSIVEGSVSKITNFGAFIRLANGIEGLIHSSEVAEAQAPLELGTTHQFKVIKVNREERKLGLSIKALTEPDRPQRDKDAAPRKQHQHRQERTERSERPERQDRSEKAPQQQAAPLKSSLQQALEDHAARRENE